MQVRYESANWLTVQPETEGDGLLKACHLGNLRVLVATVMSNNVDVEAAFEWKWSYRAMAAMSSILETSCGVAIACGSGLIFLGRDPELLLFLCLVVVRLGDATKLLLGGLGSQVVRKSN